MHDVEAILAQLRGARSLPELLEASFDGFEAIPADGELAEGTGLVDESMRTGSSSRPPSLPKTVNWRPPRDSRT